jgi:hypothetical protein
MKSDVLAPVLAAMNPEQAQKLTVRLANKLTLPDTNGATPPSPATTPGAGQPTGPASPGQTVNAAPASAGQAAKAPAPKTGG